MLSYVEVAALLNAITSIIAAVLGSMFVYRLWRDLHYAGDVGAVGFVLLFATMTLFNIWDSVIYLILLYSDGDASIVLPFTVIKPFLHSIQISAYLLLVLTFRKR